MNQRDEAHVLSLYYEKKSYEIKIDFHSSSIFYLL